MISAEAKRRIEDLSRMIKEVELEEASLKRQLEQAAAKRVALQDELKKLSDDDKFQADALSMVYEQRRKK